MEYKVVRSIVNPLAPNQFWTSFNFAGQGVAVLGISMDDETARVQPFHKKHPIDYAVGLGGDTLTKQYELDQLPVTLVFDRTGKQVKRFEGFTSEGDLLSAVRQAL